MFKSLICVLFMAGLIPSSVAQTKLDGARYCTGLPLFGPKDSLNTV